MLRALGSYMSTITEETTEAGAPAKGGVKVTDKALAKVRSAIVKEGISPEQGGLRLGVQGGGCSGSELQHPLRHPAPRARPDFPVRRCARVCRSEIVHLSERHGPGLPGDSDAAGIRVRQSECIEVVRLRYVVLRVMFCVARAPSPASLERQGPPRSAKLLRTSLTGTP